MDISRTEEEFFSNVIDEYTNSKSENFDYIMNQMQANGTMRPVTISSPYNSQEEALAAQKEKDTSSLMTNINSMNKDTLGNWNGLDDGKNNMYNALPSDQKKIVDFQRDLNNAYMNGYNGITNREDIFKAKTSELAKNDPKLFESYRKAFTNTFTGDSNKEYQGHLDNIALTNVHNDKYQSAEEAQGKAYQEYLNNKKSADPVTPEYNKDDLAKRVMSGEFGNGTDRINALTKAGYNPDQIKEVQGAINSQVAANEQRNRWDAFQKGNVTSEQLLAQNPNMSYEDYFKATGNSRERFDKAMAANAAASQNAVASAGNSNAVANIDNPDTNNGSNATSTPTEPQTQPAQADNGTDTQPAQADNGTDTQPKSTYAPNYGNTGIEFYDKSYNKQVEAYMKNKGMDETAAKAAATKDFQNIYASGGKQSSIELAQEASGNRDLSKGMTDKRFNYYNGIANDEQKMKEWQQKQAQIKQQQSIPSPSPSPSYTTSTAGTSVTTPVTPTNTNPTTTNGNSNDSGNSNGGSSNSTSTSTSSNRGSGRSTYVTHSIASEYVISTNFGEGR